MKKIKILTNGFMKENPVFKLLLGMCATLAVSTQAVNGIGMGLATTFVLVGSNVFISVLRKVIPSTVRIPCFVVVIATFVTIVQMMLKAYLPALDKSLGLFIPLIVVNCIILGRAEAFASKNTPFDSLLDGLGMGIGFTIALTLLGTVRELLGAGSIFGINILGSAYQPMILAILPPGAFIILGIMMGIMNKMEQKRGGKA